MNLAAIFNDVNAPLTSSMYSLEKAPNWIIFYLATSICSCAAPVNQDSDLFPYK